MVAVLGPTGLSTTMFKATTGTSVTGTAPVALVSVPLKASTAVLNLAMSFVAFDTIGAAANPPIYRVHISTSATPNATSSSSNMFWTIDPGTGKLPGSAAAYWTTGLVVVNLVSTVGTVTGGGTMGNDVGNFSLPANGGALSGTYNNTVANFIVLTCANTASVTRTVRSAALTVTFP